MIAEIADRQPQVLLRRRAENLGRSALVLGILRPKQNPSAPDTIIGAPDRQTNGDTLSFESYGGKIVNDCFARGRNR